MTLRILRTSRASRAAFTLLALALACAACERPDHIEIDPRMPRLVHRGETVRLHGKMMDCQGHIYPTERATWSSRDPLHRRGRRERRGGRARLGTHRHHRPLGGALGRGADRGRPGRGDQGDPRAGDGQGRAGYLVKLTAFALGLDGRARLDREVRLTSSAPAIARIDNEGQVWGVAPGEAVITAKSDDKEAQIKVTVTKK